MEPTQPAPPAPSATTPVVGEGFVEFVRTQRANAGLVLGTLAVVCLGFGIFLAYKAFRAPGAPPPDKPDAAEKSGDLDKPPALPKSPEEIANLKQGDYNVGWLSCLLAFLVASAGAAWLLASPPKFDEARQRTDARVTILAVGLGLGAVLILAGLMLFYRWSTSLTKWLDTSDTSELRWVLIPVLMIVLGGGLIFAAIQPARAEERNNATVRRVVYGSNFGLTVLLLVVAFVVVNVVIAVRVPNKLDTTSTGFYSLSEHTTHLLQNLKEPVNVYAILSDVPDRDLSAIRELLHAMQDTARGKMNLRFIDKVANRQELTTLRGKYPQLDLALEQRTADGAVLLTLGEQEKRHAVIPDSDFSAERGQAFQGEAKIYREIAILSDTENKPVVYFTQSNGEMSIDPAAEVPDDRKLTRLRTYLEKNYLDVRPLSLPLENPAVPADAAVVVVAEPRTPFPPPAAAAIRKYMTDPGKKGRLVVLAGVVPGPNSQGATPTGLEDVLRDLNVELGNKFVYTYPPDRRRSDPRTTIAGFTVGAMRSRNEVAIAIVKATEKLPMFLPREVTALTTNNAFQATPLLASVGVTWLEEDRIPQGRLEATIQELEESRQVQRAKAISEDNRSLAVVVSHAGGPAGPGGEPAAAVYGNAQFVSDRVASLGSPTSAPITFDLVGVTIDWLRGRPSISSINIEAKKYSEYQFPEQAAVDATRLVWLPLALAFLAVLGLGAGVWVVRRR